MANSSARAGAGGSKIQEAIEHGCPTAPDTSKDNAFGAMLMEISILKSMASSGSSRPLEGKVAIVTGAGRRLGRAVARPLAGDGGALVLADIDPATVRDSEDEIGRLGGAAQAVRADVADEGACHRVVDRPDDRGQRRLDDVVSAGQERQNFEGEAR